MKTTFVRVLSLLLTVAMLFSLAACNSKDKSNKNSDNPNTAQQDGIADSGDANGLIVANSTGDLDISAGVKLAIGDGDDTDLGEELDEKGFGEIGEATYDASVSKYGASPISAVGSAVTNNNRNITVYNSTNKIAYKDFQKFGCNVFPTMFTLYSQSQTNGENIAYIELNAKRFNDIHASYARSWFQIDWMMTDTEPNPTRTDYENNKDYQNYMAGIYDFNNEYMQSCIEYWRMLGEAGTEIEVSFGWKVAERIQSWFGEDPSRPRISAPKDLNRYADAAKEMFLYCYDQGLTNVNILSYYNEPQQKEDSTWRDSWDYATVGDKRVYWGQMARLARKALDSDERTKHVQIWGAEPASEAKSFVQNDDQGNPITIDKYINWYLYNNYSATIDVFTFHEYYGSYITPDKENRRFYNLLYVTLGKVRENYGNAKLAVTEFYASSPDIPNGGDNGYFWGDGGWVSSYCSYLIALANNGWHTGLHWGFVGGWVGDPSYSLIADATSLENMTGDRANMAWSYPHSVESAGWVRYNFYNIAFLNNYIPDHANVHNMTYEGEELHASAFTSGDGEDFSLLIEKKEGNANALTFNVELEKSLEGKDINVFCFTFDGTEKNIQATIPYQRTTISNVTNSIEYTEANTEKGLYTIYIFTTLEPLAQLELYKAGTEEQAVASTLSADSSISISPTLIDCPDGAEVEWEIKEYSVLPTAKGQLQTDKTEIENADLGTITTDGNTVTYTPAADAKNGDVVALRATIKGTNRFASAMIHIVK